MNYILFDSDVRTNLLPFTYTRAVADIRCGILTMRTRWEHVLGQVTGVLTHDYLQPGYKSETITEALYINAAVFGTKAIAEAIAGLPAGSALVSGDVVLAARLVDFNGGVDEFNQHIKSLPTVEYSGEFACLNQIWDIFSLNDMAIRLDYDLITDGRKSASIPKGVSVSGEEHLFIEEGAELNAGCVINALTGPVYIGKNAVVLEGVLMRGPVAVCDSGVLKMGAKVYGATTIGNGCKVGGEVSNVVFFANSNKGHDGYLGNSVVGEWCNLGADTNCSNLKNNYGTVRVWNEAAQKEVSTGLTFCGLMMGDHSKCGINTMFNTGTVVGVSCNIYGGGFPPKSIGSFAWGGAEGFVTYKFDKAMETANRMMARRGKTMSDTEVGVYRHLYETLSGG